MCGPWVCFNYELDINFSKMKFSCCILHLLLRLLNSVFPSGFPRIIHAFLYLINGYHLQTILSSFLWILNKKYKYKIFPLYNFLHILLFVQNNTYRCKFTIIWNVTSCSLVDKYHFGGIPGSIFRRQRQKFPSITVPHSPGDVSPASHRGGPESLSEQFICELWWKNWH